MLEDLGKTVIITGSQGINCKLERYLTVVIHIVPLAEWRTDAEENLLGFVVSCDGHQVTP